MTKLLTELYDITLKKEIRSANKEGWVRPTIKQMYMSDGDFEYVMSYRYDTRVLNSADGYQGGGNINTAAINGDWVTLGNRTAELPEGMRGEFIPIKK